MVLAAQGQGHGTVKQFAPMSFIYIGKEKTTMKPLSNIYTPNGTVPVYSYPAGHTCRNCPYALQTNVPGCMFPSSRGDCFRYRKPEQDPRKQAAEKIFNFIQVLERVKERKGYTRSDAVYEGFK